MTRSDVKKNTNNKDKRKNTEKRNNNNTRENEQLSKTEIGRKAPKQRPSETKTP